MKTCTKCSVVKSLSDFRTVGGKFPGIKSSCKVCEAAWREAYRENARAYHRGLKRDRPQTWPPGSEVKAEIMVRWRERNSEHLAQYRKAKADDRKAHAHSRRARSKGAGGRHTAMDIADIHARQRFCCAVCRASIKDAYHVDHIMPLVLGGSNDRSNIQLLCQTCNCKKGGKHPDDFMRMQGFLT